MANPVPSSAPAASSTPAAPAAVPTAKTVDPKATATPAPAVTPAPVAEESWDVPIDGKTEKKTRKELIEAFQLRQLSDKKRSEAEKALSEYNKLFQVSKQDPIKFMKALGIDFDNLSTSYLARKAEDAMKDPKVRELEQAKAEAAEYKKWVEEQKAGQEKAQKDAAVTAERQKIHSEIIKAIQESKDLGLPVDEELVVAIAQKMMLQDKKQKPLNAKEALPAAYASTQKWLQGMASKMEGEALVKWLGNDVALKIRKYDLTELKKKRAVPQQQPATSMVKPQTPKEAPAKHYKTWSEFKRDSLDTIK